MLSTLELTNIKSYKNGLFEFEEGVNIIVGPNASGKTNLLESIYMVCQGKAFRSADEDMINRDFEWGRINATVLDNTRVVKLKRPKEKTFIIGDVEHKRLGINIAIPVVLFEPAHMLLLDGEPERRRSYLDGLLSQINPEFKKNLASYKRTLAQRNKLLKQEHISVEHLFVWDLRLSQLAGMLIEVRTKHIEFLNKYLTTHYRSISGKKETLELKYETKINHDQYTSDYLKKLKSDFELDRLRGYTGSGPHREDIIVLLNDNDARQNASRGETRSIILSLKIAELDTLTKKLEKKPLLLLDDVFSELDGKRRRLLAQTLKKHQTFITTTDADAIIKSFLEGYHVITTS